MPWRGRPAFAEATARQANPAFHHEDTKMRNMCVYGAARMVFKIVGLGVGNQLGEVWACTVGVCSACKVMVGPPSLERRRDRRLGLVEYGAGVGFTCSVWGVGCDLDWLGSCWVW